MVMQGIQEDMGEGGIQCINHPYKNSSPGGICALCLEEKLGKLVSSSFSSAIFPPSSSSASTPCVRSDFEDKNVHETMRKSRMLTQKKNTHHNGVVATSGPDSAMVFKRSKSTTTPRNRLRFLEGDEVNNYAAHSHRKGFWSFLHYSSSKHHCSTGASVNGSTRSREKKKEEFAIMEEKESPNEAELDRKVARSRSVGCGSRSFSGDFFEKISTGLGDCTLRRIESQREGKPRFSSSVHHHNKEMRVNCGGIFGGFMVTSSEENGAQHIPPSSEDNRKSHTLRSGKNWGWALASPMRAFGKTSSSSGKRENSNNKTPNLAAVPSFLTVS